MGVDLLAARPVFAILYYTILYILYIVYMGVDLLSAPCLHAKVFVKLKIELSFARERRQLGESKKPFMSPAAALSILGGAKKMNVN